MTTMDAQLGVADEITYGTPVTVDRFYEFDEWAVKLAMGRTESAGLRPGRRTQRSDRFVPYRMGAGGQFKLDVPTVGFGWWLRHMLGTVSSGAVVDSNTEHTAVEGPIGSSFTAQVNKPLYPSGTAQPHTFLGCKLPSWELACDVEGVLVFSGDLDAQDEDTTTPLAVASYPADWSVFSWEGASLEIGGVSAEIKDVKVGANLGLDVDRRYMRGSALKKEPTENGLRGYTWSATMDHSALTNYDRYRAALAANAHASIVATWVGPYAHGGTTLPRLQVTMPAARFDTTDFDIAGPNGLMDSIGGVALDNGVDSPMTIAYRTTDATP